MPAIELIKRYDWPPPDSDRFARAIGTLLARVLPQGWRMSGSIDSRSEPGLRLKVAAPADIAACAADATAIWINVHPSTSGAEVDEISMTLARHAGDDPLELRLGMPLARKAEANELLAALERDAGLAALPPKPQPQRREAPTQVVKLERRYDTLPADLGALVSATDAAAAQLTPQRRFEATVRATGPDMPSVKFTDLAKLRATIPTAVEELTLWIVSIDGLVPIVSLRAAPNGFEALRLSCEVELADSDKARALLAEIERGFGLVPMTDDGNATPLRQVRARGFVEPGIDAAFVRGLSTLITERCGRQTRINGSTRTGGFDSQQNHATIAEWAGALTQGIDRVISATISLDGRRERIALTLEPRLDYVAIEIGAPDEASAKARLAEIATAIGFRKFEGPLYDPPDLAVAFQVKALAREAYGKALRALFVQFLGPKFMLRRENTLVAEESDDKQIKSTRFDDLDAFLARIAGDQDFVQARVVAVGPQNRVLGFDLERRKNRLDISANRHVGAFSDIVRSVHAYLPDLAPWTEPAPASAPARKTLLRQVWDLDGLMGKLVVLALTGIGFVVGSAWERLITKDTLALFSPPAAIVAGCVPVEWSVTTRRFFDDGAQLTREAGMLQIDAATGARVAAFRDFRSGDQIYLPAGEWRIHVYDGQRERRSETLAVKAAPAAQPGPAAPVACVDGKPRG